MNGLFTEVRVGGGRKQQKGCRQHRERPSHDEEGPLGAVIGQNHSEVGRQPGEKGLYLPPPRPPYPASAPMARLGASCKPRGATSADREDPKQAGSVGIWADWRQPGRGNRSLLRAKVILLLVSISFP